METYLKSDAIKILEAFKKFVGFKFQYESGRFEMLTEITISKSPSGDANFVVDFLFKNGVAITPSAFTQINGLVFVYTPVEVEEAFCY